MGCQTSFFSHCSSWPQARAPVDMWDHKDKTQDLLSQLIDSQVNPTITFATMITGLTGFSRGIGSSTSASHLRTMIDRPCFCRYPVYARPTPRLSNRWRGAARILRSRTQHNVPRRRMLPRRRFRLCRPSVPHRDLLRLRLPVSLHQPVHKQYRILTTSRIAGSSPSVSLLILASRSSSACSRRRLR